MNAAKTKKIEESQHKHNTNIANEKNIIVTLNSRPTSQLIFIF